MNELNILIVEDELIIYIHITRTLKSLGFKNIYTARTSQEALAIASNTKIDLLFSDIKIEGEIDGIDTASTLQNLYGLAVIFITAYKDKEMLKRVSKIDTIGYLLKPYRVDELEALIELATYKYQLVREENKIIYKNYLFDLKLFKFYRNNNEIKLTKKEMLFISLMFNNINELVSYEIIDKSVWHDSYVTDFSRRTFFHRIKKKLFDIDFKVEKNIGIKLV